MGKHIEKGRLDAPRWRELTAEAVEAVGKVMIDGAAILAGKAVEAGADVGLVSTHLDDASDAVDGGESMLASMAIAYAGDDIVYGAVKRRLTLVRAAAKAMTRARWACIAAMELARNEGTAPTHETLCEDAEAA